MYLDSSGEKETTDDKIRLRLMEREKLQKAWFEERSQTIQTADRTPMALKMRSKIQASIQTEGARPLSIIIVWVGQRPRQGIQVSINSCLHVSYLT